MITKEELALCAGLVPDEIVISHDGVLAYDETTKRYTRPWNPLTWQDGGPLLAKVEKWIAENYTEQIVFVNSPGDTDKFRKMTEIVRRLAAYKAARASGDSQQWLEAGFMLACAIQEAV